MNRTSIRICRGGAVALAALSVLVVGELRPVRIDAQTRAASPAIPELTGYWDGGLIGRPRAASGGSGRGAGRGGGDAESSDAALVRLLNTRAKAVIAAFDEFAAPKYDCVGATLPRIITDMYKLHIEQRPDRVLFSYEKDDVVRTVWLEGHGHPMPKSNEYFLQGYSTGKYEGNQLVVETTRFTYDPMGLTDASPFVPSSTRKKVTERYWRDGKLLKATVVTEDPVFLVKPWQFSHEWELSDNEFFEYECSVETSHELLQFIPKRYPD
jgi:hypothetical protein